MKKGHQLSSSLENHSHALPILFWFFSLHFFSSPTFLKLYSSYFYVHRIILYSFHLHEIFNGRLYLLFYFSSLIFLFLGFIRWYFPANGTRCILFPWKDPYSFPRFCRQFYGYLLSMKINIRFCIILHYIILGYVILQPKQYFLF